MSAPKKHLVRRLARKIPEYHFKVDFNRNFNPAIAKAKVHGRLVGGVVKCAFTSMRFWEAELI